ncbi:MAG: hypothetical protein EON96_17600 [Caulobacteraceae bacterium]|nr:MAG: hypothetical protein EON96_17600 [Caulobacteraceae bacterium]
MVITPVAVFAAAALVLVAFNSVPLPGASPLNPNSTMQISLIQPLEPEIAPGATMEVGDLVDGYTHRPIPAAVSDVDAYEDSHATAWLEPAREAAPVRQALNDQAVVTPTSDQPREASTGNPYGFDAPTRDYASEREARRARLDRIQMEAPTSGAQPVLNPETAFY